MFYIRRVKTASGKTAVQVIRYEKRKRKIIKHIGSGGSKKELKELEEQAQTVIETITDQQNLGDSLNDNKLLKKYEYIGIKHTFTYEILSKLYNKLGFKGLEILKNLVIIRIFEPASKTRSLELLQKYFDIEYKKSLVFKRQKNFYKLKKKIEDTAIRFASNNYGFRFKVVFYDITTLYFEAFKEDELRKCGFSKDNKFNQPQILIALIVTDNGFPIGYEVIEGNKFEGHTILPFITKFRDRHNPEKLTVVADAAMISKDNIDELIEHKLQYIVGARLGNLSFDLIKKISKQLNGIDKATFKLEVKLGTLICQFSKKRYHKDKKEMEKQIERAQEKIKNPKDSMRLCKFVKKTGKLRYEFNEKLKQKTELLLGIKGYYTNLKKVTNKYVIDQYRNLWQVEKAFRIAKSDLVIRPIYHYKEEAIKSHIMICFMALCISKHVELETNVSIAKFLNQLKSVTDAVLMNKNSNKSTIMRMAIPDSLTFLLSQLHLSH